MNTFRILNAPFFRSARVAAPQSFAQRSEVNSLTTNGISMKRPGIHDKKTLQIYRSREKLARQNDGAAIKPNLYGIELADTPLRDTAVTANVHPPGARIYSQFTIPGYQRKPHSPGEKVEAGSDALLNADDTFDLIQAEQGVRGEEEALPFADTIQVALCRHDLSSVRAHIGGQAGLTARRLGAKAYTLGNHIAFADQPDLHTAAHEAAHAIQQQSGVSLRGNTGRVGDRNERQADAVADLVVQGKDASGPLDTVTGRSSGVNGAAAIPNIQFKKTKSPEWAKEYETRRARPGALPYEKYKAYIGDSGEAEKWAPELKAAGSWGGTIIDPVALSSQELEQILKPELPKDQDAVKAHKKRLDSYLPYINKAFEIMEINTMEAQALFLAHAAGESKTMGALSEKGAKKRKYWPFIGRGLLHTTFEYGYVQTLAYLETKAERLARRAEDLYALAEKEESASIGDLDPYARENSFSEPPLSRSRLAKRRRASGYKVRSRRVQSLRDEAKRVEAEADVVREAFTAIKTDITKAEDPRYAFLFSTAYMHMSGGVRISASLGKQELFPGNEAEDRWMTSHTNPFNVTLARAIAKKKAAQAQLAKAEAVGDQDKINAAQIKINKAQGAINDMNSALARAEVKRKTYRRAISVLGNKVPL